MSSGLQKGLTAIFLAATMGIGALVLLDSTPEQDNTPAPPPVTQPVVTAAPDGTYVVKGAYASRGLTQGETQLTQKLFGNRIDTTKVKLQFFENGPPKLVSDVAKGDTTNILIYGRKNASDDYSRDQAGNFGTFVYEMTHIWQNQTEGAYTRGNPENSGYPLSSRWGFSDYGAIQQSQIMEDYARRFLHPDRRSAWLPNEYGSDRSDTDPFLKALVENQFPEAQQARVDSAGIAVRGLTASEAVLLKGIFGGQINTGAIRLNLDPQGYSDIVGSVSSPDAADFWGPKNHSQEYTREDNGDLFGTFVHELTHNWQKQNDYRYTNYRFVPKDDKYLYPLDAKYKFTDYGTEQQAAMIEDYARRFLHPSKSFTYLRKEYNDPESKASLLAWMVESQFPQARQLRENYERNQSFVGTPVSYNKLLKQPAYG